MALELIENIQKYVYGMNTGKQYLLIDKHTVPCGAKCVREDCTQRRVKVQDIDTERKHHICLRKKDLEVLE